jgi:hypothetical protein
MSWSYADTATTEDNEMDQNEIDILERNLKPCPFCQRKPFFETESPVDWFVTCDCGARIPGDDAYTATAKWNTRPLPVARNVVRSVPREHWTGY